MARGRADFVYDVAVVGAGPAGSAAARWLALRGWHVVLIERSLFEAPRIGESLPPNVQELLCDLGVWDEFLALAPLPSWGTTSVWGDEAQQSHAHLFSPYGCGWHVDRRALDQLLANAAVAAGTDVLKGVTLRRAVHRNDGWSLETTTSCRPREAMEQVLRARVLIDATGRSAQVALALGAQRIVFDRLVGVAMHCVSVDAGQRSHLLVEAVPEGWWYSAPLPGGTHSEEHAMIAMLMTDADLCHGMRLTSAARWQAKLQSAAATCQRLDPALCISTPRVHCARSHRLSRDLASDARPWLAVGDASLSLDPISGGGVMHALSTARCAADAVSELFDRPLAWKNTLAEYEAARDSQCTNYLFERATYYAAEQRFDTPFWQRRRVLDVSNESQPSGALTWDGSPATS